MSEIMVHNDTAYFPARVAAPGISAFDGQTFFDLAQGPDSISDLAAYRNQLLALGSDATSTISGLNSMIWAKDPNAATLSSDVFWDKNGNCQFDVTDSTLIHHFISFNQGQFIFTPSIGNNSVNLPAGSYTIDSIFGFTNFNKYLIKSCSWPQSITLAAQQNLHLEFPLDLQKVDDASVQLIPFLGWRSRHGFTETYEVVVRNLGGNTMTNLTLSLDYDQGLTLGNSSPPATSSAGSLTWNIPQLNPLAEKRFSITFTVSTANFNPGDQISFAAQIIGAGDADLSNNQDSVNQNIVAACDPNDKTANASHILPSTHRVDYHIRFQNTGTDTAYKVTVVDTLEMSLPVTQIIINSASHPYSLSVKDNILIWEFDNILLPDSGADYAGSQGYVRFSAGLNPSLAVGDTIDNDAEIYFDYQNPVHTNHAKTVIVNKLSLPEGPVEALLVEVFPNPAASELHLWNHGKNDVSLELRDTGGRLLDKLELKADERQTYSVSHLPVGVYFLSSGKNSFRVLIRN